MTDRKFPVIGENHRSKSKRIASPLVIAFLSSLRLSAAESPVAVADLIAARAAMAMKNVSSGGLAVEKAQGGWNISGAGSGTVVFAPADSEPWSLAKWNYARLEVRNDGSGVVTVDGRLDNQGGQDWTGSAPGFAVVPSGTNATVGFPFNRADSDYRGADIFRSQLAKPNGHRSHWKSFDPSKIRAMRLVVRSAAPEVKLFVSDLEAAWPVDAVRDAVLEAMPYLDEFGQVRAMDWPGKVHGEAELSAAVKSEFDAAAIGKWSPVFDRFGGWANGPKLKATGSFRTEKKDGRWWMVDPDGNLFWSVGACCVGFDVATPITKARKKADFFAWLPGEDDPLQPVGIWHKNKSDGVNFAVMNLFRVFGTNWNATARDAIHGRMHAWGVNTIGAWSADEMMRDAKTPYTLTAGLWWPVWKDGDERMVSPFDASFEKNLREQLEKFSWAKDDPFCIGAFIDNELEWPDEFTPKVFAMPDWEPTKKWVLEKLKAKYPDVAALNAAWGTSLGDWKEFFKLSSSQIPAVARTDIEPLYLDYAKTYFAKCKKVMNEVLPGKLYLGCRTHRGPKLVGRAALGSVDVFSVNCYDSHVAAHQLEAGEDIPVIASEFHFGAVDRGVPSPGLRGVHDQTQRGLCFANYLASALADPRFVGCHWFQWNDQSAAGRPDRENHQCGFVDITGRGYPEFTRAVSRATTAMYEARSQGGSDLQILSRLIAAP